ncbi:unnamed protein product [Soboliphyme baturini]|uniref:DRMBL domain-containing protein n=1 Tax=Soboliphyme baturini TaxID=241478 RepID=A0A183J9M5_9BILA|nr:unnamed protein product [Soboliphyme baturini]
MVLLHIIRLGAEVISHTIDERDLLKVEAILRRKPLIWDNIHNNDYDCRRLILGPFSGRSTNVKHLISGILLNPNCQAEVNYICFHTFAKWNECKVDGRVVSEEDAELEAGSKTEMESFGAQADLAYFPLKALRDAIHGWVSEFNNARSVCFPFSLTKRPLSTLGNGAEADGNPARAETMDESINKSPFNCSLSSLATAAAVTVNSLADDYSEPMELTQTQPAGIGGSNEMHKAVKHETNTNYKQSTDNKYIEGTFATDKCLSLDHSPRSLAPSQSQEMMEVKSADSLCTMSESCSSLTEKNDSPTLASSKEPRQTPMPDQENGIVIDANKITVAAPDETQMQVDKAVEAATVASYSSTSTGKDGSSVEWRCFSHDELKLLVDMFYLPNRHGESAVETIDELSWLYTNAHIVRKSRDTLNPDMVRSCQYS